MADVLVVGGGVIGLTTAVCLAEQGLRVQVRTAHQARDTTSAAAGAMLGGPIFAEPFEAALRWQQVGMREFGMLAEQPGTGVHIARGRLVSNLGRDIPEWAPALSGFRHATAAEHAGFQVAFWINSPLADMPVYLGYLADRFTGAGGDIRYQPVTSLWEAADEALIVVNCSGVYARRLAEDPYVHPVRGQHVVVENPGIEDFFFQGGADREWTGFMPHDDNVVLGGVAVAGDWNLAPDPRQTWQIMRRCAAVEPRLADARVLRVDVGLRPGRAAIRLEAQTIGRTRLIHNYGHGGVGVSMSWGCARDVTEMILVD
ncbi:MAG TPA: FAD-dependent oxidoreductase [Thermopolyspora sp.]|jgi:Glycine/D-amino acid oxidases (deaminating)